MTKLNLNKLLRDEIKRVEDALGEPVLHFKKVNNLIDYVFPPKDGKGVDISDPVKVMHPLRRGALLLTHWARIDGLIKEHNLPSRSQELDQDNMIRWVMESTRHSDYLTLIVDAFYVYADDFSDEECEIYNTLRNIPLDWDCDINEYLEDAGDKNEGGTEFVRKVKHATSLAQQLMPAITKYERNPTIATNTHNLVQVLINVIGFPVENQLLMLCNQQFYYADGDGGVKYDKVVKKEPINPGLIITKDMNR